MVCWGGWRLPSCANRRLVSYCRVCFRYGTAVIGGFTAVAGNIHVLSEDWESYARASWAFITVLLCWYAVQHDLTFANIGRELCGRSAAAVVRNNNRSSSDAPREVARARYLW